VQFRCFPLMGFPNFWRFFAKFIKILLLPKESFPSIFNPKIQFQVVWVPQTLNLPFKLGEIGSNFGGSFDGACDGRWKTPLQGVFHPWKFGKGPTRNGGDIGGPKWGSKFLITPALSPTRKTLDADNEKMPFWNVDFLPILQAGVQTNGTFDLCKPLNRWG